MSPAAPSPGDRERALRRTVLAVAGLNGVAMVAEVAVALVIGSVSLFADAVDFGEDTAINLLIFLALGWSLARRAVAGRAMAIIICVPALAAVWEAVQKFQEPTAPDVRWLIATAGAAAVVNTAGSSGAPSLRRDTPVVVEDAHHLSGRGSSGAPSLRPGNVAVAWIPHVHRPRFLRAPSLRPVHAGHGRAARHRPRLLRGPSLRPRMGLGHRYWLDRRRPQFLRGPFVEAGIGVARRPLACRPRFLRDSSVEQQLGVLIGRHEGAGRPPVLPGLVVWALGRDRLWLREQRQAQDFWAFR